MFSIGKCFLIYTLFYTNCVKHSTSTAQFHNKQLKEKALTISKIVKAFISSG